MNFFVRWARFNLVGVVGIAVQLTTLALFNHWMPRHYLFATALAIELTLLHNFIWHVYYTWRDRRQKTTPLTQLARFHLSNGLTSMLGNLILMRLLVHGAHLPLLAANLIAIASCSVANFFLGNYWAFTKPRKIQPFDRAAVAHLPSTASTLPLPTAADAGSPQSASQRRCG